MKFISAMNKMLTPKNGGVTIVLHSSRTKELTAGSSKDTAFERNSKSRSSTKREIQSITKSVSDTSKSMDMIAKPKSGFPITKLLDQLDHLKSQAQTTQDKLRSMQDSDPKSSAVLDLLLVQLDNLKAKAVMAQERTIRSKGITCSDPFKLKDALFKTSSGGSAKSNKALLQTNCTKAGLQFRDATPDNGDCFFEAIRDQLKRLGMPVSSAKKLRKEIVVFLRQNPSYSTPEGWIRWQDFVCGSDYLLRMSRKGEHADHVIVFSLANQLKRDIVIVTSRPESDSESNIVRIKASSGAGERKGEGPILLGHSWENHFQSLQPLGSEKDS